MPGYQEVELISVWSHPSAGKQGVGGRGWISGRWVVDGIAVKLPAFNRRNLSIDLFVSLRPQGHTAHGHPPFFFPVSSAVTLRPVTNGVDLALRTIWVTALLEPTGQSLTKRIDSGSVSRPAVAGACFWRNHGDDAIVSIKAVYQAEQIATLDPIILCSAWIRSGNEFV